MVPVAGDGLLSSTTLALTSALTRALMGWVVLSFSSAEIVTVNWHKSLGLPGSC
jgi:hypothetical protein